MSHDINTSNAGPTSATVSPAKLRILLACGVIAGQLFVGVAALRALTRDGFGPQPSLPQPAEPGDLGWIQVTNFVVPGLLPTAFAVGTWLILHPGRAGTWGAILRGVFGSGLVAGGVFVPDPSLAYPPGAPGDSRRSTPASTSPIRGTKAVPLERPYAETRDVLAGYWIVECDRFRPATKLQAGLRPAPHQNMSPPTAMPTCGRSWNPQPKFPSQMRGADKAALAGKGS
jgi:hypothetical protein